MDVINTSPALDCKTMIAILNGNPDGVAILGAFNGMETLAREDPEGCVRAFKDALYGGADAAVCTGASNVFGFALPRIDNEVGMFVRDQYIIDLIAAIADPIDHLPDKITFRITET